MLQLKSGQAKWPSHLERLAFRASSSSVPKGQLCLVVFCGGVFPVVSGCVGFSVVAVLLLFLLCFCRQSVACCGLKLVEPLALPLAFLSH